MGQKGSAYEIESTDYLICIENVLMDGLS